MATRYILSAYMDQAMADAVYDKLEDGTFAGRIPTCEGVVAFGGTLHGCEDELRSTLEDWILVGLKLGHSLPVIGGVDLNKEPTMTDEVASQWGDLNKKLVERAWIAAYGHRKLATFLSERMDFDNCLRFHPVYFNDYSSWCLK